MNNVGLPQKSDVIHMEASKEWQQGPVPCVSSPPSPQHGAFPGSARAASGTGHVLGDAGVGRCRHPFAVPGSKTLISCDVNDPAVWSPTAQAETSPWRDAVEGDGGKLPLGMRKT